MQNKRKEQQNTAVEEGGHGGKTLFGDGHLQPQNRKGRRKWKADLLNTDRQKHGSRFPLDYYDPTGKHAHTRSTGSDC